MIYLTTSKVSVLALSNEALVITLLIGQLCKRIFFGRLREAEVEHLYEKSWCVVLSPTPAPPPHVPHLVPRPNITNQPHFATISGQRAHWARTGRALSGGLPRPTQVRHH